MSASVKYRLPSTLGLLQSIVPAIVESGVRGSDDWYDGPAILGRVVNPYILEDRRSEGRPGSRDLTAEGSMEKSIEGDLGGSEESAEEGRGGAGSCAMVC
jgi:hypothetical protein